MTTIYLVKDCNDKILETFIDENKAMKYMRDKKMEMAQKNLLEQNGVSGPVLEKSELVRSMAHSLNILYDDTLNEMENCECKVEPYIIQ